MDDVPSIPWESIKRTEIVYILNDPTRQMKCEVCGPYVGATFGIERGESPLYVCRKHLSRAVEHPGDDRR
jgi:hypothetical protein